ncbi:DUF3168 domain-containing protein [Salipiger sp. H15]|uniref:DUF3168 domain-containing protein n=1 Tax=Alloyangia sp. H15 TaxID=3029062 RepID=A0AAU8AME7_9RHOB
MEEYLRSLLLGNASVSALAGDRVNWGAHPQGAGYPAAVLTLISETGDHTLDGPSGVSVARVQVDCLGTGYGNAKRLAHAIRSVLDGYRGGPLKAVFFAGARDGREGGTNDADRPFRTSLDVLVHYTITT